MSESETDRLNREAVEEMQDAIDVIAEAYMQTPRADRERFLEEIADLTRHRARTMALAELEEIEQRFEHLAPELREIIADIPSGDSAQNARAKGSRH